MASSRANFNFYATGLTILEQAKFLVKDAYSSPVTTIRPWVLKPLVLPKVKKEWTCTRNRNFTEARKVSFRGTAWRDDAITVSKNYNQLQLYRRNVHTTVSVLFLSVHSVTLSQMFYRSFSLCPSLSLSLSPPLEQQPNAGQERPILEVSRSQTTTHHSPLDGRSAHRKDIYLTTHSTHNRQASMFLAEFGQVAAVDNHLRLLGHWDRQWTKTRFRILIK
jgi:hypothetical protein